MWGSISVDECGGQQAVGSSSINGTSGSSGLQPKQRLLTTVISVATESSTAHWVTLGKIYVASAGAAVSQGANRIHLKHQSENQIAKFSQSCESACESSVRSEGADNSGRTIARAIRTVRRAAGSSPQ